MREFVRFHFVPPWNANSKKDDANVKLVREYAAMSLAHEQIVNSVKKKHAIIIPSLRACECGCEAN